METLQLVQMLYHQEIGIRQQAALIVGMVEETSALVALEQRVREETDANVKKTIMWAGNRVLQAEQRGYSTIDSIFDYFHINRELASGIDPEEAELLRHESMIQSSAHRGGILGDIRLGSMMTADSIQTGHLGKRSENKKALLRQLPSEPSDIDISVRVNRLMDSSDMKRQKNAAIELRDINNPQALPYLGLVFYRKENLSINDYIEHTGKVLYWNANYAAMDKNGRLKLEIAKRRREGRYSKSSNSTPQSDKHQTQTPKVSVTDILNQGQQRRKKDRH